MLPSSFCHSSGLTLIGTVTLRIPSSSKRILLSIASVGVLESLFLKAFFNLPKLGKPLRASTTIAPANAKAVRDAKP